MTAILLIGFVKEGLNGCQKVSYFEISARSRFLDTMASYRLTAQRRKQAEIAQTKQRWQQAQNLAQQAATFLRETYGVETVILFGSTLERDRFHLHSDLDLAISGLSPEAFFTAVAQLQDLSPEFKVDLVSLENCQDSLRKAILAEGRFL